MGLSGETNLTVSQPILDEMADVFARKFDATPKDIEEAKSIVRQAARIVKPSVSLSVIEADPDDDSNLECAVSAGSDFIVTADKHLLRLGAYDGIRIVTVARFLEIYKSTALS